MDGWGKPAPATAAVGAFEAPAPAKVVTADGSTTTVKPSTDHVSVDLASGATTKASQPVQIPKNVQWQPPVTAVQAAGPQAKDAGQKAVITYVGDGDSVAGNFKGGGTVNCRIDGIDAPEVAHPSHGKPVGQPYGEDAKKLLQDMIDQKEVTIRVTKPSVNGSNYGRSMCQIEISGKDVSKEMVRAGAAMVYERYAKDPELFQLQNDARTNKRGLWANPNPINPEHFRHYGK